MGQLRKEVRKLLKRHRKHGSPRHGHQVPGLWDGDSTHPAGTVCKEYRNWERLRQLID